VFGISLHSIFLTKIEICLPHIFKSCYFYPTLTIFNDSLHPIHPNSKNKTMSALALQRIREAKEQRLTRLDLGNCGLTELPDELFELVWFYGLM
jgi:hypothetical protein